MELFYHCNIREFSSQSIFVFLASSQASKSSCQYSKTNILQVNGRELEEEEEEEEQQQQKQQQQQQQQEQEQEEQEEEEEEEAEESVFIVSIAPTTQPFT